MIYKEACSTSGATSVAYTTFCNYWRTLLPHIIVGKPMTDLCWTCQQNSSIILKAVNKSTEEKSAVSKYINLYRLLLYTYSSNVALT